MSFCGSYRHGDVEFLLKPLPLRDFSEFHEVATKEQLIQNGQRHYSEMLSPEKLPSAAYMAIFEAACVINNQRMAHDCLSLAQQIRAVRGDTICLVSLARAGTPLGVILKHLLQQQTQREVAHYSISIIRDRGIDQVALDYILQRHSDKSLVFVDGWTGKGVISRELAQSIAHYNALHGTQIDPGLFVLADLAGTASHAASDEDYLIPSSILNATVSGLVSRSILNQQITQDDFHGCVYYDHFASHDRSQSFVDAILALACNAKPRSSWNRAMAAERSAACIAEMKRRFQLTDENLIKPGIGEATRVLLRRLPWRILLRDATLPEVRHLLALAEEKQVSIEIDANLAYLAIAIVRSVADA